MRCFNYDTLIFEYYLLLWLPGGCIVASVAAGRSPPELVGTVIVETCVCAVEPSVGPCVAILVSVDGSVRPIQTIARISSTIVVAIVQSEPRHLISHDYYTIVW